MKKTNFHLTLDPYNRRSFAASGAEGAKLIDLLAIPTPFIIAK